MTTQNRKDNIMAKMESSLKNMLLSLGLIALCSSALIGVIYEVTKEPISLADKQKKQDAIRQVLADKTAEIKDPVGIVVKGYSDTLFVYPSYQGEEFAGAAIQTYSNEGYGGKIEVMVGIDPEGNLVDYAILAAAETPGLGAKVNEWFKTGKGNILGKNPTDTKFSVTKDGGDVDAITASTITSRAFLEAVNAAYAALKQYQEQK